MKKQFLLCAALLTAAAAFCQTKSKKPVLPKPVAATAATTLSPVAGTWMYGNFSLTEYWTTSPRTYLGNAFTFAVAFKFNANGTYEQYFTSGVNNYGISTYHQSVTKGTYKMDEATATLSATPVSSHYKRTSLGRTEEDRDMRPGEIAKTDTYTYAASTEPNGTQALSLTITGTKSTLTFLKKSF